MKTYTGMWWNSNENGFYKKCAIPFFCSEGNIVYYKIYVLIIPMMIKVDFSFLILRRVGRTVLIYK